MHFRGNYTGVVDQRGAGVVLSPGPLGRSPRAGSSTSRLGWVSPASPRLGDPWRSPPPSRDCTTRPIPAFSSPGLLDAAPRSPEDFAACTPGFSSTRSPAGASPGSGFTSAEGEAKAAARGPRGRPNAPRCGRFRIRSGGARTVTVRCGPGLQLAAQVGCPRAHRRPRHALPRRHKVRRLPRPGGALPQLRPGHTTPRAHP